MPPISCYDGSFPEAGLVQGIDGGLYGATQNGGAGGTGFRITAAGVLTGLAGFFGPGPDNALVVGTDGNFYGATPLGGNQNSGTVFKMTARGTLSYLYNFCSSADCADGAIPAGVVEGTDGNFYGTTEAGGTRGDGTVFKITPEGNLATLYSFCSESGCSDGSTPYAGLVQASNGNFYGVTNNGGDYGVGTVFEITPSGALTTLHGFTGEIDGAYPVTAALIQGADGNLYGTTSNGGISGNGTVFEITPGGTLTTLYSFCGKAHYGAGPGRDAERYANEQREFSGCAIRGHDEHTRKSQMARSGDCCNLDGAGGGDGRVCADLHFAA